MGTLSTVCAYHPKKPAIAICQQCRKSICELDLNKAGFHMSLQNYDLCFFCYKGSVQTSNWFVLVIFLIMPLIIFIVLIADQQPAHVTGTPTNYLSLAGISAFPDIIILPIFFIVYIYGNNKLKEASKRYFSEPAIKNTSVSKSAEIQNNVQQYKSWLFSNADETTSSKNTTSTSSTGEKHSCSICGTAYEPNDLFCPNCGNKIS